MSSFSKDFRSSLEDLEFNRESSLYKDLKKIYLDAGHDNEAVMKRVVSVIKKKTGINIGYVINPQPQPLAYICFFNIDPNNVFRGKEFNKLLGENVDLTPLKKLLSNAQGSLSSKGKVTGIFTKLPCEIVVSKQLLDSDVFSNEEKAAITLHEVGHVFSYFESLGRVVATSIAITRTQRVLQATKDIKKRKHFIDKTVKVLNISDIDTKTLAEEDDENAVQSIIIRSTITKMTTDVNVNPNLFAGEAEYEADSFAVRSGASQPLLSALVKVAKWSGNVQTQTTARYSIIEGLKAATLASTYIYPPLGAVATLLSGIYIVNIDSEKYASRLSPLNRIKEIRKDLLRVLKDRNLTEKSRDAVLKDLEFLDSVKETVVERFTLVTLIALAVSPRKRRIYNQAKLQEEISELVDTDLFAQSAKLKHLSKKFNTL